MAESEMQAVARGKMFQYYSLGCDTAKPCGLHGRLCHAFLAIPELLAAVAVWIMNVAKIIRCGSLL